MNAQHPVQTLAQRRAIAAYNAAHHGQREEEMDNTLNGPMDVLAVLAPFRRDRSLRRGIANCMFFAAVTHDGCELRSSGETQDQADARLAWRLQSVARIGGAQ